MARRPSANAFIILGAIATTSKSPVIGEATDRLSNFPSTRAEICDS
jgi:hypothetical protein